MSTPGEHVLVLVGATGAVGRSVLGLLATRRPVWREVRVAGSDAHVGSTVPGYGRQLELQPVTPELFEGADVAVLTVPPEAAREAARLAVGAGVPVVDCSPVFRADADVPLVVPEVNPAQIAHRPAGIVASPSASSTALAVALAPLHRTWELTEVVVTAMQAVSGLGDVGTEQLVAETLALVDRPPGDVPGGVRSAVSDVRIDSPFPAPVAANVVPVTSELDLAGWSVQEARMRREVRKLLRLPDLRLAATTTWVPVLRVHSLVVHATFAGPVDPDAARQALVEGPNAVVVLDDPGTEDWPSPVDMVGSEPTFVGRIRVSPDFPCSLEMFVCADNLNKGSALNLVQIAEAVVGEGEPLRPSEEH